MSLATLVDRATDKSRFQSIQDYILALNIDCVSGIVQVSIKDDNGKLLFNTSYQHDLLISEEDELKIIGSVKTSSKDRIDKIFIDKFLYRFNRFSL